MGIWNWLFGLIRVRITSADVLNCLSLLSQGGVSVYNWEYRDELNIDFTIKRTEYKKMLQILSSHIDEIKMLNKKGLIWKILQFVKRPVLSFTVLLLLILNIYLPNRVLFVFVEGNTNVPTRKIVEEAQKLGLKFGSNRREIRSESVKNGLLEAIPQLQWSGVNTAGCVATISVRERQPVTDQEIPKIVSSIVAIRDGVIQNCTATKGNLVCKPGQAVKAGEILISGYSDCGIKIMATRAEGEVYAKTERKIALIYPRIWQEKTEVEEQTAKYSLIFGKKRINLYNDSGILHPTCGKMYKEIAITLPSGFVLPISVVIETWNNCSFTEKQVHEGDINEWLSKLSIDYLKGQMVAGQILASNEVVSVHDAVYQINGKYSCVEMIAQEQREGAYGDNR